jgi:hypothetical protein
MNYQIYCQFTWMGDYWHKKVKFEDDGSNDHEVWIYFKNNLNLRLNRMRLPSPDLNEIVRLLGVADHQLLIDIRDNHKSILRPYVSILYNGSEMGQNTFNSEGLSFPLSEVVIHIRDSRQLITYF